MKLRELLESTGKLRIDLGWDPDKDGVNPHNAMSMRTYITQFLQPFLDKGYPGVTVSILSVVQYDLPELRFEGPAKMIDKFVTHAYCYGDEDLAQEYLDVAEKV